MSESKRPGFLARYGFRTPVRGHAFAASPPGDTPLTPGAALRLVREPNNPRDTFAIAVWTAPEPGSTDTPWRIGYLDQLVAARLAPLLDDGQRIDAHVDGWVTEPLGRWQRPLIRLQIASTDGSEVHETAFTVEADPDRYTSPSRLAQLGPGVRRRRLSR